LEEEDFSRLPGALIWAKAMLHWFQWLVWLSGKPQAKIADDPRLKGGVRGLDRGPQLAPGLRCVCSRLLMAQAVSTSDQRFPEPLTGLLPATLSLARLLLGQGQSTSWPRFSGHPPTLLAPLGRTVVFVPEVAPAPLPDAAQESIDSVRVAVRAVELGSAEAAAVASAHLTRVISRFKIATVMIDLENVHSKADVGNSENLWTAVLLYRAANKKVGARLQGN